MSDAWQVIQTRSDAYGWVTRITRGPHYVTSFVTLTRLGGWFAARRVIARRSR